MGQIEVVLIDAVPKLGEPGDVRVVKAGYFRNYLGPHGKARYATRAALAEMRERRAELEKQRAAKRKSAEALVARLRNITLTTDRPSKDGRLYGSIRNADVRALLLGKGISVPAESLNRNSRIKSSGQHSVSIDVYPGISAEITINVNPGEVENLNVLEWIMATPEEQFRSIMKEEVGDKIEDLNRELRSLRESFNSEMAKSRAESGLNFGRINSDIGKILEHLGLDPSNGPK